MLMFHLYYPDAKVGIHFYIHNSKLLHFGYRPGAPLQNAKGESAAQAALIAASWHIPPRYLLAMAFWQAMACVALTAKAVFMQPP